MTRNRVLSLAFLALIAAPVGFAQQPPQASAPAPSQHGPKDMHKDMKMMKHDSPEREHGMGIVPPGTWWKNPEIVTSLALTADQQKKLDDTFMQSRISLIHLHASLEEEQLKLEPLLNANPPDQAKSLAQISKIADLRADLEKTNAKMLLSLRGVLTADQWTKMQADLHNHHEGPGRDAREDSRGSKRGPGGPGAPGGPQGPGSRSRGPQGPGPQGSVDHGPGIPPPPADMSANQ